MKILIFDEPTSLLSPPETERFLSLLRTLQASGHTILFISHRLHEVLAIADRISVMNRGRCVGTHLKSEITVERLVQLIVSVAGASGKALPKDDASHQATPVKTSLLTAETKPSTGTNHDYNDNPCSSPFTLHPAPLTSPPSVVPLLGMRDVTTRAAFQDVGLDRFSLEVLKGEIFGLGGVVGNGQRTLARLLAGTLPLQQGTVFLCGREITSFSISDRTALGLRWLPANPPEESLLPSRPLWENLLLGCQRQATLHHHGWLNLDSIKRRATAQLDRHGVVYASLDDQLSSLSGGNSQKLALSRVLEGSPELVILEQPGRGLDIRAQEHLRNRVRELNQRGVTFLVISYDLDELLGLSKRIGVLYRGRMMGIVTAAEASREQLGSWMLGVETGNWKLETGEAPAKVPRSLSEQCHFEPKTRKLVSESG